MLDCRGNRQILEHLPAATDLLFSATIPRAIGGQPRSTLNPEKLLLSEDYVYVKEVSHEYYITNRMQKERNLCNLIEFEDPTASMIFCNTREETRTVANYLGRKGLPVAMLSSDLSQARREKVMARFRRRELRHLVATDVAARGIDIEGLTHVFIFSAPSSPDQYVHRAGRTGHRKIRRAISWWPPKTSEPTSSSGEQPRVDRKEPPLPPEVAARKSVFLLKQLKFTQSTARGPLSWSPWRAHCRRTTGTPSWPCCCGAFLPAAGRPRLVTQEGAPFTSHPRRLGHGDLPEAEANADAGGVRG
jgi:hypothetical protein